VQGRLQGESLAGGGAQGATGVTPGVAAKFKGTFALMCPSGLDSRSELRQLCQNMDIRVTKSKNNQSEAASHFQEDLMVNLSSRVRLEDQFSMRWTSR
jgi:hypothetical protein